ncbi:phosphotransferase [Streptomyces camponoticapitis]|uniref:Phosphotransferase n=1 Tax=Streptomyces camponoticapitis TaxID=1616125 RepID=A0ABQ2E2A7_9ACTN|nr:phosphotransferase [Streptomyces camponoticapitis]GGJ82542.1 phosphotransferase [Streptomyces camponoticapitis]
MRRDASVVPDRGQYPDAVTPWEQDGWREAALGWVERQLAAHGLREAGRWTVRLRPWSVLVRIPVEEHDTVWFKANPPGSAFEGGLTEALAGWVPEHVLKPLAVDTARGWSLLPDGGPLFRDVLARGSGGPRAWEQLLRQYAEMQLALRPYTEKIELLGVPNARPAHLPEIFDSVVDRNTKLEPADRRTLRASRPRLVDWCEELAGIGIADSLDHSDLHEGQLFAPEPGRFTFFDWGDAAVSHPFCSLLVPALAARARYGSDVLPRLRDAYLEPWTGSGQAPAELRRAVTLAWRLGAIGRACSWGRLFPGTSDSAEAPEDAESAHWLVELFAEPPL